LFRELYPSSMHGNHPKERSPEEEDLKNKFRDYVEQEFHLKQPCFVRGKDRHNRAIIVKRGRVSPETLHEAYENNHFYIAERAIATTEFLSRGQEEKVLVIMDFEGYSSSNAPSLWTQKETIGLLITHYPERLAAGIVSEPAFWMRAIYNVVCPLLSQETSQKIQMLYAEAKHEAIRKIIDPEQAMPFMIPEGQLTAPVEPNTFFKHVPYYCHYDP
jgi:CRAL/TRIO domain